MPPQMVAVPSQTQVVGSSSYIMLETSTSFQKIVSLVDVWNIEHLTTCLNIIYATLTFIEQNRTGTIHRIKT